MLAIRRTRPGIPVYWVLPGGGVEPGDESREAALYREIHEEIAGKADIVRLLHTMSPTTSASSSTSPASRPGPSRTAPARSSAPRTAANTCWRRFR
ncbi:NUDIX domain-containing protein [Streptomyces showdoensis]|uniref:NUDIX domain-containing protein n=1 Tax=Streptomyces showdoensis TaxID=68268 RepID=UPI0035E5515B